MADPLERVPTRDFEHLPGQPARLLRGQKDNPIGDILRLANSPQRDGVHKLRDSRK